MDINIMRDSKLPIYMQIHSIIKSKIIDGEMIEGFKLPSERSLAQSIGVHRNTVIRAYDELIKDELIESSVRRKAYIVVYQKKAFHQDKDMDANLEHRIKDEFFRMNRLFNKLTQLPEHYKMVSFGMMYASEELMPTEEISNILRKLIDTKPEKLFGYCDSSGLPELRKKICKLVANRQIHAQPSNIQIVSEVSQALDYIAKLYLKPGDCIVAEEPLMPNILHFFSMLGIKVITAPMDRGGIKVEHLEHVIQTYQPKFFYTLPTFHNPSMITMSLERRYEVLHCCEKYGLPLIEEDCISEFRYEGVNLPSLYAISGGKNVIYIDALVHSFIPAARIGYMIAPKSVSTKLGDLFIQDQLFVSTISQYVASEYIASKAYDSHIAHMRQVYKNRRDLLCNELRNMKNCKLQFIEPEGGMHVWCALPKGIAQKELFDQAYELGLTYLPGFLFFPYGSGDGTYMRLAYSYITEEDIKKGVALLDQAMKLCLSSSV